MTTGKAIPTQASTPAQPGGPLTERSAARLKKAAREFEAIFVGYMLKAMRGTIPTDEESGGGFGGGLMEGLFDMQLANRVSAGGNLGVGEMLARKLVQKTRPAPAASDAIPAPVRCAPSGHLSDPPPATPVRRPPAESLSGAAPAESLSGAAPAESLSGVAPAESLSGVAPAKSLSGVAPAAPVGPDLAPAIGTHLAERLHKYTEMIEDSAARHGLDSNVVRAVIAAESGARAQARSPRNAKGLMQLTDATAADMGVGSIWDPRENIEGGVKYLRKMLDRFDGNLELALASYNAGPRAVERHGGVPPFRETRQYVTRVSGYIKAMNTEAGTNDERD